MSMLLVMHSLLELGSLCAERQASAAGLKHSYTFYFLWMAHSSCTQMYEARAVRMC